ncbi:MAG TPA: four helix bundle protein [Thermoanaerobaculia bacterium]
MKSFHDLRVWNDSVEFATAVYRVTEAFPPHEQFGLTAQVRRAAVSIASNIAEGQGRMTSGEWLQFLGHSRGSLFEAETQLIIAARLGMLQSSEFEQLDAKAERIGLGLTGLINWVSTRAEPTVHRPQPKTKNQKPKTVQTTGNGKRTTT